MPLPNSNSGDFIGRRDLAFSVIISKPKLIGTVADWDASHIRPGLALHLF